MRIRYSFIGKETQVECDLDERVARQKFNKLSNNLKCAYAELVGEDDNNYMEIIDSFDHYERAKALSSLFF